MTLRALFSLDDTTDVMLFARKLIADGYEIIASQETAFILETNGIPVTHIEYFINDWFDYGFPPTLHPKIEMALTKECRDKIDLVYVIPYGPAKGDDVGGRTILELARKGGRIAIDNIGDMREFTGCFRTFNRESEVIELAWGENPYQDGAEIRRNLIDDDPLSVFKFEQLSGNMPEYTNVADLDNLLITFCLLNATIKDKVICVAGKHGNACGVGVDDVSPTWAIKKALAGNERAIWGGELIINEPVSNDMGALLADPKYMLDVVAAPYYTPEALGFLGERKNRKVFGNDALADPQMEVGSRSRLLRGGIMYQSPANYVPEGLNINEAIAWAVAYSSFHGGNEIALTKANMLIGVGGGPSTVEAAITAVQRAKDNGHNTNNATFCADAFFSFTDAMQVLIDAGCKRGVAPMGGRRFDEVMRLSQDGGVEMRWFAEQYRGFCRH